MDKENFIKGLKAETSNTSLERGDNSQISQSEAEMSHYTCLKLMGDGDKIFSFIDSEILKGNTAIDPKHQQMVKNYYYTFQYELGRIEYDYRKGIITGDEFKNQFNKIYEKYSLSVDFILEATKEIDSLGEKPDSDRSNQLIERLGGEAKKNSKDYEKE